MEAALTIFLEYILPELLKLALEKKQINEAQKVSIEALAATEEFLGGLKIEEMYPAGKNGANEAREPNATNINRENVTG